MRFEFDLSQPIELEKPQMLPKTSESSVPGCAATNFDTIYEPSVVSETALVRMVMQALQGSKVALDDIDRISTSFCFIPADTTVHRVPNAWQRSSSVASLGKLLGSFGRAGRVFLFLREFVDYFHIGDDRPPHSLVNQAFAVAVRTLLEGYICALNTLSTSVKLRRSINGLDQSKLINSRGLGNLTSVVDSDITVLEVYLHTKELRIRFEVLGNICCFGLQKSLTSVFKALAVGDDLGFDRFLRGADLLTYLYLQLRDSDLVHHGLLKFLFTHSWAPYYSFIKSWIYKAKIDDPHMEFFVDITNCSSSFDQRIGHIDDILLTSAKERNDVSIPCFLQDVYLPLFRTGQQLQVLIKLLEMCNCPYGDESNEANACNLASYEDVLPFWTARLGDPWFCLSSITFCRKEIRKIMTERDIMYTTLLEKLQFFFKDLNSKSQLLCFLLNSSGLVPHFDRRIHSDSATSILIECLDFSGKNYDNEAFNVRMGLDGIEISSTSDDSFNEKDDLQFSESSSFASSEEIVEITSDPDMDYAFSNLSKYLANQDGFERMHEIEKLLAVRMICKKAQKTNFGVKVENENVNLKSDCLQAMQNGSVITSDSVSEDYHSLSCWPLGGLSMNPFITEKKHREYDQLNFNRFDFTVFEKDVETLDNGQSYVSEFFIPGKFKINPVKTLSDNGVPSWISTKYDLNRNPMLSDIVRPHATCSTNSRDLTTNVGSNPYFDFSMVLDPNMVFLERSNSFGSFLNENSGKGSWDIGISDSVVNESDGDGGTVHLIDGSNSESSIYSSSIFDERILEKDVSEIISGGANWEVSLRLRGKRLIEISKGFTACSSELFDIPLDIVVDRCILQEILLQYKYVSNFTIKLLDEGFGLREHFMALRRYHFIELGDWADLFTMSLWNHKWRSAEAKNRIPELQSLLHVALQRSSCESDPFWKRLFVYTKEQNSIPLTTSTIGAFDNMVLLGYKIDWPVNIVVTSKALNIYADIFSFLMQIRLALYSLSHMWKLIKDLRHSKFSKEHVSSVPFNEYSTFMKIRLQVNHFVSTLQQYVQSQLSDVSCCRFLHSLQNEVKDMLDLESMHMLYLVDSLNICFLSTETKEISSIIKSILQCALNFHSCIIINNHDGKLDSASLLAEINFPQVASVSLFWGMLRLLSISSITTSTIPPPGVPFTVSYSLFASQFAICWLISVWCEFCVVASATRICIIYLLNAGTLVIGL